MSIIHYSVAGPAFLSPLQTGLLSGIGILVLLLSFCIYLLVRYRRQFLIFSKKCEVLEPQLEKTSGELRVMTNLFKDETERRARMQDNAGAATFQLDEEGACVYVNTALTELCGFSAQSLYDYGLRDAVHTEDRADVRGKWVNFASEDSPIEFSYRLQRQDGRIVHVIERGSVLRDKQGTLTGYLGQLMDVSDLVQACDEARAAEMHGSRFIQQTAGGFYKLDLDEPVPMNLPAKQTAELIYERATITSCCDDLAEFYGRSAHEMKGAALKDLEKGCGFFESRDRIRSFVEDGLKMSGKEEVRTDYRGTPVYLSCSAVGMVENDQLVSIWGTQLDISRQKREQEEAAHREEFLRRILDSLPGDIFVKDPRCRYLFVNKRFETRTDIPVEDWIDKTVFEVLPAAPRDTNKSSIEAMKSGRLCRQTNVRQGSDSREWVETLEQPLISDDGVVEGVVGISIDVTDQMIRQHSLESSEAHFRHLIENNPAGIILADAASKKLTYANPAFCDLFGYTEKEISALKVDDLHSPGSRRQVLEDWNERAQHTLYFDDALPCLRKDRTVVFAEVGVASGQIGGTDLVVGVYSDAAGRKKVESELEHQRDIQTALLRSTSVLVATVDCAGKICFANDALLELLGQNEPDLVGKSFVDTLICEEDRETLQNLFANPDPGYESDIEFKMTAVEGTRYLVACRVRAWTDPSNKQSGFTVSGMDVTELREREAQLRAECDSFRNRLAEREEKLAELSEKHRQTEQQREQLVKDHKQLEDTLAAQVKRFEKMQAEREQREAELSEQIQELESRKTEMVETLEVRRTKLEEESGRCEQLEEQLTTARNEFTAEKERMKSETQKRIETLEQSLEKLRAREAELASECSRLNNDLSDARKELQSRVDELESDRSEWEAKSENLTDVQRQLEQELEKSNARKTELNEECEHLKSDLSETKASLDSRTEELGQGRSKWESETKDLLALQQKLEGEVADLTGQLQQVTEQRDRLEQDLKVSREDAETGMKTVQVQIKQSTAPLEQEIKELRIRKKQLEADQEKSGKKLAELKTALSERSQEIKATSAARKEEQQTYLKTQKELKKQLQMRASKISKLEKQIESDAADRDKTAELWKKDRNTLLSKTQELEVLLRERTHELTFAVAAGREKEESFETERQELRDLIAAEKDKHARILAQTSGDIAEHCREKEAWEDERKALQDRIQELEDSVAERAEEISQASAERYELEKQLEGVQEEAARQLATVDEQIEQKTKELTAELKAQSEREEKLKQEQKNLMDQLETLQKALEERSKEVDELQKTRQELEELVELEKESLAHRISLFKEEMNECRKAEEAWQLHEQELQAVIANVEKELEQRNYAVAYAVEERKQIEREVDRLKKSAAKDHRMIVELTEDLTDPLQPVLDLSHAILTDKDLPVGAYAPVQEINQSAERLRSILEYRRGLACMETGAVVVEPGWFDLNDFLTGLAAQFTEQAENKKQFFTFSRKGSLSGDIYADQQKVRTVLSTLYDRALHGTQKGPVGLHTVCETRGDGSEQIVFLLMYSGVADDPVLAYGLANSEDGRKPCSELSEDDFRFDLVRRTALLMGGRLSIENPSERKPVLSFVLPVERRVEDLPAEDPVKEVPAESETVAVG